MAARNSTSATLVGLTRRNYFDGGHAGDGFPVLKCISLDDFRR
jgi:hypothetical protein